jgi:adenylate cyclase
VTDRATEQVEQALLGGPRRYTRTEAAAAAGVSLDRSQRIWLALGFAGHGRVVKSLGDEVLFVADSAHDAAEIAVGLSGPARSARGLPQLRVGMALGRILIRFGDVYGPAVNLASRLTSLARPGMVLVDRELAQALRGEHAYRLHPRRPAAVRGYSHLRSWSLRPRTE